MAQRHLRVVGVAVQKNAARHLVERVGEYGFRLAGVPVCQNGKSKNLREIPGRTLSTTSLTRVVPSVFSNVVDDRVGAFRSIPLGVEPPNLTKTRNLRCPNLLTLIVIQVVKKVVLIHGVRYFFDHAVV